MMRAEINRHNRLLEFQEKLSYQNQVVKDKVTHAESSDNQKEYETLNRYCDRQVKSRKFIKKKVEEREEHVQWKRQKEHETSNLRKMRINQKFTEEMQKLQKSVNDYQERWHQTGFDHLHEFDHFSDSEIGRRVKKNLRE